MPGANGPPPSGMVPGARTKEQIMSASQRSDVYARVTQAIVDAIEAGTATWRMPWHHSGADVTRPTNVASGRPYRGINTVSLWAAADGSGYTSGVWGTYRQWQALGAQVRKGEHSSLGILWKEFRAKDDDAGDDDDHRRLFAKAFSLFNADQVDGYAPEPGPDLPESERLAAAEAFIAALGIETVYGSASAYYHIAEDRIHMPDFRAFHDAHGFYATHIHEVGNIASVLVAGGAGEGAVERYLRHLHCGEQSPGGGRLDARTAAGAATQRCGVIGIAAGASGIRRRLPASRSSAVLAR